MCKIQRNIRKKAIKKARQSPCRFKIAALGFNAKGELVIAKTNSYGRASAPYNGLHAEERVFRAAQRKNIVKVIIVRVNLNGIVLPIDPCKKCQKIADKLGIKIETIKN